MNSLHELARNGDVDGVRSAIQSGVDIDDRDPHGFTPLCHAILSEKPSSLDVIHLLLECSANANAIVGNGSESVLSLAACKGDLQKLDLIASAIGTNDQVLKRNYTPLVLASYKLSREPSLIPVLARLIQAGVSIDHRSDYGESPMTVNSRLGRFDAVQFLISAGAAVNSLQWTPLMEAIAIGTTDRVELLLRNHSLTDETDHCGRSVQHLIAYSSDSAKWTMVAQRCGDLTVRNRHGDAPIHHACGFGNDSFVHWYIHQGFEIDLTNKQGETGLMIASGAGHLSCVQELLDAGADPNRRNEYDETVLSRTESLPIAKILIERGCDPSSMGRPLKRQFLGLDGSDHIRIDPEVFQIQGERRFGLSNPESIDNPAWNEMIRTMISAQAARDQLSVESTSYPSWCFDRFGMSLTLLPDGRAVHIGGEHEDFYDPDFCIYNDAVVHERNGMFRVYGYPAEVFPPTDFHTATYHEESIIIIGGLGYQDQRQYGTTPVYRLDCRTWKITPQPTIGYGPGWIHKHQASILGNELRITGGKILAVHDGKEMMIDNQKRYRLSLSTFTWHQEE
jgi:ankyrin repeat protein